MSIVSKFDQLLSLLNAEENELAIELRAEIEDAFESSLFLTHLEDAGVDNWSGYGLAQEAYQAYLGEFDDC